MKSCSKANESEWCQLCSNVQCCLLLLLSTIILMRKQTASQASLGVLDCFKLHTVRGHMLWAVPLINHLLDSDSRCVKEHDDSNSHWLWPRVQTVLCIQSWLLVPFSLTDGVLRWHWEVPWETKTCTMFTKSNTTVSHPTAHFVWGNQVWLQKCHMFRYATQVTCTSVWRLLLWVSFQVNTETHTQTQAQSGFWNFIYGDVFERYV